MNIFNPILDSDESIYAYDQFTEIFNADRKLGEQLRYNHRSVMRLMHNFFRKRLQSTAALAKRGEKPSLMLLNTYQPISLTTNNKVIAKFVKVSTRTVQRLIKRLEEANVIIKVFHGWERNYTIILNPLLLFIADAYQKNVFWKPAPNMAFSLQKKTICPPKHVSFGNSFNNKIIHSKDSNKFERFEITDGNNNGNTGKCANISSMSTTENPLGINMPTKIIDEWKQNIVPVLDLPPEKHKESKILVKSNVQEVDSGKTHLKIIKANLDRQQNAKILTTKEKAENAKLEIKNMRRSYAILMVQLMIEYLLPKSFKANKGYFNEVVEYVTDQYFGNIQTFIGIEKAWKGYSVRLEDARKFKLQNPTYTPYPRPYFDKTNPKGFDNPDWHKNKRKWEKNRRNQTDQRRLMQSIRAFNKLPTSETYQQQIEKLRTTVHSESTFRAFFKIVADNNGGQLPNFNYKINKNEQKCLQ